MKFIDNEREFSKEELLYVYRKVKRDLYFEKDSILLDKIVDFENGIKNNIDLLYQLLANGNSQLDDIVSKIETGDFNFLFKNINFSEIDNFNIIAAKTVENFQKNLFNIDNLECRFIGDISINFQIIGGLWINRIGYKIDEMLSSNVYGCRLEKSNLKSNLKYYKQNSTLFRPYFNDFKNWQNNLFKKIEQSDHDIIVVTSDLRKYYHTIDVNLLENKIDELLLDISLNFTDFDIFLNKLLFALIRKFNKKNNDYYSFYENVDSQNQGLPLTLNVSKVLANFHLKEFDDDIIKNVKPLYYGRYVDDFIIAVENNSKVPITLKSILKGLKHHVIGPENEIFQRKIYHSNERFFLGIFNQEKEKIFSFNYEKDKGEIDHLKKAINKNSSEWKLIPDISQYEEIDSSNFFNDVNKDCEEVDSLRKSTGLTIKRNQFVREIIGFENNINFLNREYWGVRLDKFLDLIFEYVFDLKNFIDLSKYIPRLFGIVIHSEKYKLQSLYFEKLEEVIMIISEVSTNTDTRFASTFLKKKIFESIVASLPLDFDEGNSFKSKIFANYLGDYYWKYQSEIIYKIRQYFNTDLHRIAYKDCYFKYDEYVKFLDSNLNGWEEQLIEYQFFTEKVIDFVAENLHSTQCGCENKRCEIECKIITQSSGFFFYTRKISLLELTVAFKNKILSEYNTFYLLAKSYSFKINIGVNPEGKNEDEPYFVDFDQKKQNINSLINPIIATTHFFTDYSSFDANVRQILDTDLQRYDRVIKIVNDVIRSKKKINYLVFHELALPRSLYVQLAAKLSFANINLIAGLEYKINRTSKEADNQLVYILKHAEGLGHHSIALFQSKLIGAVHEVKDIWDKANLKINPVFKEKLLIKHDGFVFSGLICNDLLYIKNRSELVEKIDNLFVIAWNQDIETYEHLVKSSCLDIHCFVTLCNNREYGDTRIRAPYKASWKRDVMKIHGGMLDNFVLSELDIKALRNFQTNEIPPEQPFKPFPIGFKISPERRLI